MNKYMEQNWRVENIFLISSQHFLNVTDWEWEALYKHLLYQEGNRCFCRRACLPRVPIPTVGKSGSPPSLNAEEAKTAASPHPCTMLVPKHWSQSTAPCDTYAYGKRSSWLSFLFLKHLLDITDFLTRAAFSMAAHKVTHSVFISFSSGQWQFIN